MNRECGQGAFCTDVSWLVSLSEPQLINHPQQLINVPKKAATAAGETKDEEQNQEPLAFLLPVKRLSDWESTVAEKNIKVFEKKSSSFI